MHDRLTAVLICRFILDLRRVDRGRAGTTPSSVSGVPTLLFATGSLDIGGPLPEFIAAMGSEVYTGRDFMDSIDGDEDIVQAGESGSQSWGEGLATFDENDTSGISIER